MPAPAALMRKKKSTSGEVREGSEKEEEKQEAMRGGPGPDDSPEHESAEGEAMPAGHSRKRSAKGAKNTKAPMDGECGSCKSGNCSCDSCKAKRGDSLLTPAALREDLKCGKGAISKGEKCHKGAATEARGPNAAVRAGQAVKAVGRGALETVKWTSGYNIGKFIATGATGGRNEKGPGGAKAASVLASTFVLGPIAGLGAARRSGLLGATDLQQHAQNEKKEKKWRKSVGYKDSAFADGFAVDYDQLAV